MENKQIFSIQRRLGLVIGIASVLFALNNTIYTFIVYSDRTFSFAHTFSRIYLLLIIGLLFFISAWKNSGFMRGFQIAFFLVIGFMYSLLNETGDLGAILLFTYAILLAYQYKYLRTHFYPKILTFLIIIAGAQFLSSHLKPDLPLSDGITSVIITLVFFYLINLLFSEEIKAYKADAEEIKQEYDSNRIHIKTGKNLTGVVHNIKSKLTSVLGFNELIREEAAEIQKEELTEYAELQFQAVNQIIDQVQNLLFTVANSEDTEARLISFNRILDGAIELLKAYESVRHEPDITRNLTDDDGVFISPLYLVEIIENILQNAFEAAPADGEPHIEISTRKEGPFLVVSIADNGRGLEEYYGRENIDCLAEEVFKPGKTTKEGGNGLGMSSTVEVVKACGGNLFMTTSVEGTRFDIHLPAEPVSALTKRSKYG